MPFSIEALRAAKALLAECTVQEATALLDELAGGTVQGTSSSKAPPRAAAAAPTGGTRRPWTEEQKRAAAERMKKRWASGAMNGKVGRKKGAKARKESDGS